MWTPSELLQRFWKRQVKFFRSKGHDLLNAEISATQITHQKFTKKFPSDVSCDDPTPFREAKDGTEDRAKASSAHSPVREERLNPSTSPPQPAAQLTNIKRHILKAGVQQCIKSPSTHFEQHVAVKKNISFATLREKRARSSSYQPSSSWESADEEDCKRVNGRRARQKNQSNKDAAPPRKRSKRLQEKAAISSKEDQVPLQGSEMAATTATKRRGAVRAGKTVRPKVQNTSKVAGIVKSTKRETEGSKAGPRASARLRSKAEIKSSIPIEIAESKQEREELAGQQSRRLSSKVRRQLSDDSSDDSVVEVSRGVPNFRSSTKHYTIPAGYKQPVHRRPQTPYSIEDMKPILQRELPRWLPLPVTVRLLFQPKSKSEDSSDERVVNISDKHAVGYQVTTKDLSEQSGWFEDRLRYHRKTLLVPMSIESFKLFITFFTSNVTHGRTFDVIRPLRLEENLDIIRSIDLKAQAELLAAAEQLKIARLLVAFKIVQGKAQAT